MHRLLHLDLKNRDDRNVWYLVLEIFWASFLGSAAVFNSAYAIHLNATNTQVGLLSSVPALMAVIISIPVGHFLQGKRSHKPWILSALMIHRTGFLFMAILPWLKLAGLPLGSQVILLLIINTAPATFFNVGWTPMLAEVVPEERRAAVFAVRNITYNISVTLLTFLFGQMLVRIALPLNYQLMYIVGYAGSLLSMYYLMKIEVPDTHVNLTRVKPASVRAVWVELRDGMRQNPGFVRFSTNTFLHAIGLWMVGPLYIIYFVRNLNATDAWIGLQGMVASAGTIVGYMIWRSVIAHWGESKTLKRAIVLLGGYPILVGLLPGLTPILFAVALNSIISPGVNLSHFNTLLRVTPPDKRAEYNAFYTSFVNLGAFVGPLLGVMLSSAIGIAPTLIVCGVCSVIGSTSFRWRPVEGPFPTPDLQK